jgi:glycosidase
VFEFHISRAARERYRFADTLFSLSGNVVFADLAATREFAHRMNLERDVDRHPERAVQPGALNAMGLIDEAMHVVAAHYRKQRDPRVMVDALSWFAARLGEDRLERTLVAFVEDFPALPVSRGELSAGNWLAGSSEGIPHRAVALEELMLLWLANLNRAFRPFSELFSDEELSRTTSYSRLTAALRDYFETRPRFGREEQNLIDLLRAPALASPDSLEGQLAFIRDQWEYLLGDMVRRMLTALDILKEEQVAVWMRFHPPVQRFGAQRQGDSGAGAVAQFGQAEQEYERFTPDQEWMPRAVVLAKSVYVWLDQLSKMYKKPVHRLDQIPDQELDLLARRGFNGLWLIGLWERSAASQRIKQMTGNAEAAASAYSLRDYAIAEDLGGEAACAQLRDRARARGIRLASDLVPNHTGIDSRWVIEHPDWFISLRRSPFPAYSFDGPDVGGDGRVEIKIEDHYYDRTDAAVVFRRVDRWTGDTLFIYHGNDGTSFPWNDTAQLNYLKPEVREAMIRTILHVARMFPIIRFDAAMTLAKRHYQRLWFPEPGTGGSIPSRAEHGMSKPAFDAAMPQEFWREVVDRVAAEAPDTLLIAEAFWLMEGYFVRTLGMHRVYNSAFMNMLRDEENANYRSVLKNTLSFDPEVLKRYVNFMNNPDERTAVDQFGKGDKYFGVCTLMATLPGLPMFGHGQLEGYTEKYGMEYKRAYHDEQPDVWLVARHEREITPLLHRRYLFAEVQDFLLYDFFTDQGNVSEDVFAFSNRAGDERAVVVFNNRYASTRGWIRVSCAYAEKSHDGSKRMRQRTLGESLRLSSDPSLYLACRDVFTGLEFLYSARDLAERGMNLELHAYQTHVFLDWRDLRSDTTQPWGDLCRTLGGRGIPSLDDALRDLQLEPVHRALLAVLDPATAEIVVSCSSAPPGGPGDAQLLETWEAISQRAAGWFAEIDRYISSRPGETMPIGPGSKRLDFTAAGRLLQARLRAAVNLFRADEAATRWPVEARHVLPLGADDKENSASWSAVIAWCVMEAAGRVRDANNPRVAAQLFDVLRLRGPLADAFSQCGMEGDERWRAAARIRASFEHFFDSQAPYKWIHDADVAWLMGANQHEGVSYLAAEQFERLLWWMSLRDLLEAASEAPQVQSRTADIIRDTEALIEIVKRRGYRIEALEEAARGSAARTRGTAEEDKVKSRP